MYRDLDSYKILDNGAAEGHGIMDLESLVGHAQSIGADEIVVPDVLADAEATIQLATEARRIAEKFPQFKYMGVVQGDSYAECIRCMDALKALEYIEVLALPRHLCTIHPMERASLADALAQLWNGAIHCLGASQWAQEVWMLADRVNIRGIDTSMPIWLGLTGVALTSDTVYKPRPSRYFDLSEKNMELVHGNITTYLEWAETSFSEV